MSKINRLDILRKLRIAGYFLYHSQTVQMESIRIKLLKQFRLENNNN